MFVHTYNDIEVDSNSRQDGDAANDWKALMPYDHVVTNQAAVLEKYKCAPSSLVISQIWLFRFT